MQDIGYYALLWKPWLFDHKNPGGRALPGLGNDKLQKLRRDRILAIDVIVW